MNTKLACAYVLVAKRRLAFLNKKGYDRFGRNELFAPLMNWLAFKNELESLKDDAKMYEDAYNSIQASVERQAGVRTVLQALPQAARIQVGKERDRLVEARRIAVSQKWAYVSVSRISTFFETIDKVLGF